MFLKNNRKTKNFFNFSHDFYISQSDYVSRTENKIPDVGKFGETKREYAKIQIVALNKIISTFGDQLWKKTRCARIQKSKFQKLSYLLKIEILSKN